MRAVTFTLTVLFAVAVAVTEVAPPYTAAAQARDGELRVATFNIHKGADGDDHYDLQRTIEAIASFNADVVALQEMGSTNALLQLRDALRAGGLDYPHWEHVTGHDTNIQTAVLSRFPIVSRRSQTNLAYVLDGRRFLISRAFIEVDLQVTPEIIHSRTSGVHDVPKSAECPVWVVTRTFGYGCARVVDILPTSVFCPYTLTGSRTGCGTCRCPLTPEALV